MSATAPAKTSRARKTPASRANEAEVWPYDGPMTWDDVCAHPALEDLPFRIEQDEHGRILMSPTTNIHSRRQRAIARVLEAALGSEAIPECSVDTSKGVKVADVAWLSEAFVGEHGEEEVFSVAPPICVEVMSPSNPWAEMEEKVTLYLSKGAQEVWICEPDGRLRWFGHEGERTASVMVPDAPATVTL
ncbi:MAG: Uma2 family endonuclease [Bacteroidota bacterium]